MNDPLRILFMGTPDFAVPGLRNLLDGPETIVAVACQPDRKKGRGKKLVAPPVKQLALEAGIPLLQPNSIRSEEFLASIEAMQLDLIVVAAYGKILPEALLNLPRLGTINVHGSLLPKYRGAAPIQWAIIRGESETGITIMQMDKGMDTGDILLPASLPIGEDDTAGTLFAKLAVLGGDTLIEAINRLKAGSLPPIKQNESLATEAPPLTKEQGHLDWNNSARDLHCLIRGLDPWPSAYSFLDGKRFRFFSPAILAGDVSEVPGTICRTDPEGLLIATAKDYLLIREIQPEGKKRMSAQACCCGTQLSIGDHFS